MANLSVEDITGVDYMHAKRVCKDFEIKTLGEYHDFHLKKYILLLENLSFRFCLISFISWFSMTSSFKKGWGKIRIINWYLITINGWKRH